MNKEAGLTYLKIKIKHLALEPALVKLEEQKKRRKLQLKRLHMILDKVEPLPPYEEPWLALQLREHRLLAIRPEARSAQIAYAYLRGKAYRTVEAKAKFAPDWKRVAELVFKYGDHAKGVTKEALVKDLTAWAEQEVNMTVTPKAA